MNRQYIDKSIVVLGLIGLFVAIILLTSGCANFAAFKQGATTAVESKRNLNDDKLHGSELLYCDAPTAGSIVRRYGKDSHLWISYWGHCNQIRGINGNVEVPPEPASVSD